MTDDLSLVTHVERLTPNEFLLDVPTGWEQGRGAFGGLVVGALVRAALESEEDATRTLRTVAAELIGPVPAGPSSLTVTTLRRGNGLSAYDVTLRPRTGSEAGNVLARASVTLARTRNNDRDMLTLTPPSFVPFDDVPVAPIVPPIAPAFTQHLEFRLTGPLPFFGGPEARAEGWVFAKKASRWGAPEWVALADAYWPSILALESAPRATVTVSFQLHLFHEPPEGPLYLRARTLASKDGFVSEVRELWSPDGRLVALNPQLFAIVK